MNAFARQFKTIDIDTHVVEPYDLWTSRLSVAKYGDSVPHVKRDETGTDCWYFGGRKAAPAGAPAMAGWHEYPPLHPKSLDLVDPSTWRAEDRLKLMDKNGIYAQVLFPNVVIFDAAGLLGLNNPALMLECVRAYNDWQTDYASLAPKRFLPQMILPFWDMAATLKEMERCAKMGHRGICFTSEPEVFNQPRLTNPHWDKVWRQAEEMGLPVNFHIGSGEHETHKVMDESVGKHANYASMGVLFFMSNAVALTQIICGGICHRFPKLNFILVESGLGWLPFALASLDWQWINCGAPQENPTYDLLPSEYFKRQIYGSFWFERDTLKPAIEALGADNVLFETDFPHPTSMSPGPATSAVSPPDYIEAIFKDIPKDAVEKILHGNAARLYHID